MNTETIRTQARLLAKRDGLINLSRKSLSEALGIPDGTFPHVAGISFTALVEELRADPDLAGDILLVNKSRTSPALRYSHILGVAVDRARALGWNQITRATVAEAAGISEALVSHYFGNMDELRAIIMQEAIRRRVVEIVAQGLAAGNVVAKGAPEDVKQAALAYMMV